MEGYNCSYLIFFMMSTRTSLSFSDIIIEPIGIELINFTIDVVIYHIFNFILILLQFIIDDILELLLLNGCQLSSWQLLKLLPKYILVHIQILMNIINSSNSDIPPPQHRRLILLSLSSF